MMKRTNKAEGGKLKDHRKLGRELDLFSFHEYAPGAIFWHPKGWSIFKTLQDFIREKTAKKGYQEISTPVMVKSQLYKQSGHWEHFGEHNMFNLPVWEADEIKYIRKQVKTAVPRIEKSIALAKDPVINFPLSQDVTITIIVINKNTKDFVYELPVNYSLKPMNCPESALVFASHVRSYQDLPIKFSEFGILHRRELSGVLGGAFRLRQFTIDDAHIFVRPDQIQDEIHQLLLLTIDVYESLGFKPKFYLATRPDKAMGDKKSWVEPEKDLSKALKNAKVDYGLKPKDGAFYGPKIDIHIKDSQKRDWQLATIQLDFQIPKEMKLSYIDSHGTKKRPIMIHRAILGSFERFIGILTEHFQGAFPVWLSPIQVKIIPIADRHSDYGDQLNQVLLDNNFRSEVDNRSETMQAKIRDAEMQKIPYMLIVGDKERVQKKVSVRSLATGDEGVFILEEFITKVQKEITS